MSRFAKFRTVLCLSGSGNLAIRLRGFSLVCIRVEPLLRSLPLDLLVCFFLCFYDSVSNVFQFDFRFIQRAVVDFALKRWYRWGGVRTFRVVYCADRIWKDNFSFWIYNHIYGGFEKHGKLGQIPYRLAYNLPTNRLIRYIYIYIYSHVSSSAAATGYIRILLRILRLDSFPF